MPQAFTEKGLYMLAAILKSPVATQGATPPYRMNREHLSRRYTTS